MNSSADDLIQLLGLQELPEEGGMFREVYRSVVRTHATKQRRAATSILYLMKAREISRWHLVKSDEIWMYHAGSPAIQLLLFRDGTFEERVIGPDIAAGEFPQSVIPAWTWQSAVLQDRSESSWGLFGAMVCPGFEKEDFVTGKTEELIQKFPDAKERILELGL